MARLLPLAPAPGFSYPGKEGQWDVSPHSDTVESWDKMEFKFKLEKPFCPTSCGCFADGDLEDHTPNKAVSKVLSNKGCNLMHLS